MRVTTDLFRAAVGTALLEVELASDLSNQHAPLHLLNGGLPGRGPVYLVVAAQTL